MESNATELSWEMLSLRGLLWAGSHTQGFFLLEDKR